MPYACRDREMGNCSGRAYKRKGVAWILCRHHWYQLLAVLHWAATDELLPGMDEYGKNFTQGRVGI